MTTDTLAAYSLLAVYSAAAVYVIAFVAYEFTTEAAVPAP